MGRRGSIGSVLSTLAAIEARQRKVHNAEIRRQNSLIRLEERKRKAYEREVARQQKENAIQYAIDQTREAEQQRSDLVSILKSATAVPIKIHFKDYLCNDEYKVKKPKKPELIADPPDINQTLFKPKKSFLDLLSKNRFEKKKAYESERYEMAVRERQLVIDRNKVENDILTGEFNKRMDYWNKEKERFIEEQITQNKLINKLEDEYKSKGKEAVEFYFTQVISKMYLPDLLEIDWDMDYDPETGIFIIDLALPTREVIPTLKSMKYITTRQEFTETELKDKEIDAIFDEIILQLCLKVVHDVFVSDTNDAIKMVAFNGVYTGINKSNGKEESKYILSLQVTKEDFVQIDVTNVEARACFKSLKGICGIKLSELVPIAPIISMNRDDKRFVQGIEVADSIEGQNLASMNWQTFEHLIRELFEKEFAVNSAEIKITQASRDGGIDAVMFDPDPIKGGKFIIQAKRYTNVVGVSAVRDLFGTLNHEGAVKGILVTTANFGADSYEFAKNKPLTLINGNNLLFLLQKHGYNTRIDIEEAKKMLKL